MNSDEMAPIADYTIEKVPIGLLSNSIFTPDLPLRATQPTIGYFMEKRKTIAENTYGVHKSKYGGIGETKCILGAHEQIVARKTQHLRTALHGAPEPPMAERIRAKKVAENKGFFSGPINKVACDIFYQTALTRSKPLPKFGEKQLFPRSFVYEIGYMKERYQKALSEAIVKERKEYEELIREQKAILEMRELKAKQNLYERAELTEMEQNEEMKTEETTTEKDKHKNILEENTNRNVKSCENMKEEIKITESCTSVCGTCGCILARGDCPSCRKKTKPKPFQLGNEMGSKLNKGNDYPKWERQLPKLVSTWGSQRQSQMMRVNYPFKSEAARWHYCSFPPVERTFSSKPPKKRFPEKGFSSLNI